VQRGLGSRYYRTPEQVRQRVQVIARQRKATPCRAPRSVPIPPPTSRRFRGGSTRPPWTPAGHRRLIFQALAGLRLNPARGHDPPTIPTPPPLQARLLELLNVDPTRPRWAS